ncbi:MAG TPA: hypothetical protein PLL40_15460, partial [Dermatophilaceae bacterium]|nr:hypothetical protein [Dermatophilaceae bacterium]
ALGVVDVHLAPVGADVVGLGGSCSRGAHGTVKGKACLWGAAPRKGMPPAHGARTAYLVRVGPPDRQR